MRKFQTEIIEHANRRHLPLIQIERGLYHPVAGAGLVDCCALATVPEVNLREDLFWETNKRTGFGHLFEPRPQFIELAIQRFSKIVWNGPTRWCDDLDLSTRMNIQRGAPIIAASQLGMGIRYFDGSLLIAAIKLPARFLNTLNANDRRDAE